MYFYKNVKGDVFYFESGASTEVILEEGLTPMTDVEIEEHLAPTPDTLDNQGVVSHAQLLAAMTIKGMITEAEMEGWLSGTLPTAILTALETLPFEDRVVAKARAVRPSIVEPTNVLVSLLAEQEGKSEQDMIDLFKLANSI